MIVWINGAFGAGKTTTATLLTEAMPGSLLFDPEDGGGIIDGMACAATISSRFSMKTRSPHPPSDTK